MDDRLQLRALVEKYALSADRRDGKLLASLFVESGKLLFWAQGKSDGAPTATRSGPLELAQLAEGLTKYQKTMHLLGQQVIDFTGDASATSETYCVGYHFYGAPSSPQCWMVNVRYLDSFTGVDDRWLIEQREVSLEWSQGTPLP